jgi:hypothetical protein
MNSLLEDIDMRKVVFPIWWVILAYWFVKMVNHFYDTYQIYLRTGRFDLYER